MKSYDVSELIDFKPQPGGGLSIEPSQQYVIRTNSGRLLYSILTGKPMLLSRSLAEETRADLDFENRHNAPHRIEPAEQQREEP